MGSIILQRSFEAQREKREPPVEYSLDREPWRAFRSSLAVQFTSCKSGGWSADDLSAQARAEIISGLEARSAIIRRYSRIQSAVRDLVRKAGFSTSRGDRRGAYVASNEEILIYARKLAADDVRLAANRQMFGHLFDRVEVTAKAASLIVHGFVEVREEKSGAILFRFNQWGKRQSCSSEKLRAEAIAFDALAKDAERLLAATSAQL